MQTGKRYIYAIIGFLAMLLCGACYAWGVFVIPLETQYGMSRGQTSLAFTLNVLCYAAGLMITGRLARRWKFFWILRLGACLLSAGFLLASLCSNSLEFYLSFSLLCGAGSGICYNAVVSSVPQWFPEKPGLVTGVFLVGYALSTAIFGPVAHMLIEFSGISSAFSLIGTLCFFGLTALSFGLRTPDEQEKATLPQKSISQKQADIPAMTYGQMLRSLSFWVSFFGLAFTSGIGLIIINHISPLLTEELAASASEASIVLSLIFLCNAAGRIVSGWAIDNKGFYLTFLSISLLMFLSISLMLFGMSAKSTVIVSCGSALALFGFGANASLIPNAVRTLFGQKYFSFNYSLMNLNIIIVSFMPTIAGLIQSHYNEYSVLFVYLEYLALGTCALSLFLLLRKTGWSTFTRISLEG